MFPLHQGSELCFQISSSASNLETGDLILPTTLTPNPHHTYHAPLLHGVTTSTCIPAVGAGQTATTSTSSRRRKKPSSPPSSSAALMEEKKINNNNMSGGSSGTGGTTSSAAAGHGHDDKKVMHREIERQRRQGMSTLYASLRNLLPLQFIKGKRSMSEHMNEAVNYIKELQRRIQDLDAQKSQLLVVKTTTTLTTSSNIVAGQNGTPFGSGGGGQYSVEVRRCLAGLEIVLASEEGCLRLSGVMRLLLEEGVSVVNCVSTKVNHKCFHTLVAEVEEDPTTRMDMAALQQKLMTMMTMMSIPPPLLVSSSSTSGGPSSS